MDSVKYLPGEHPDLKPPIGQTGLLLWLRKNFFSSTFNIVLTFATLYFLYVIIPPTFSWLFVDSVFVADSRVHCRELGSGACWGFIDKRLGQFTYGFYPVEERWRGNLCFLLFVIALLPVLWDKMPKRKMFLWFSLVFPLVAAWLLLGGFGLESVPTDKFGGFMLTMVIGVTGVVFSLPLGILLALGRQSNLHFIRWLCTGFIEFFRGVPLITLLFVASTMLNYFLPPGTTFDLLLRVLIMVTLFSAA